PSGQRPSSVTANPRRASSRPATSPVTPAPTIAARRCMRRQDARISRAMRSAVAMLAMSAVALLVVLPNHPAGRPPSEDAGVFFYGAPRILHGGRPYRDIGEHPPPGVSSTDGTVRA